MHLAKGETERAIRLLDTPMLLCYGNLTGNTGALEPD